MINFNTNHNNTKMKNNNPETTQRNLFYSRTWSGFSESLEKGLILCSFIVCIVMQANGQSASLDQVRNGPALSPVSPGAWVNGNVNASQAHMVEGYSVSYRMQVTGLTSGAHRLDIAYDTRVSSKNAIDYLTQFNRIEPHITQFGHPAEVIDPLISTGLISPSVITFPIPVPGVTKMVNGVPQPQTSFNALLAAKRAMTMFNGLAIDSITYLSEGSLTAASSSTTMRIWFRTNNATVVFAWGGHIASQYDWGTGNSASSVSGSPYHMHLIGIDGAGGSQDRALQASAVSAPQCLISGPTTVCSGSNFTYTGPTGSGYSYEWAIVNNTTGAAIVGSNTGQSVSVNPGNSAGTFGLQITVSSGLSVSTCNIIIAVTVPGICSITPAAALCPGAGQTYTGPAGMAAYQWSVTGSGNLSGSSTGQTVNITAGNVCNGSFSLSLTITKNGCSATCGQNISVIDTGAPAINQPGNNATLSCPATPVFTAPTATDACDPNPSIIEVSDVTTPGSCVGCYSRTKTWNAVDVCGNQSVLRSQTINVVDNTAPTIGQPGVSSTISCPATPVFNAPTATDACDANPSIVLVTDTIIQGSCANRYTRTKKWKAVDACGNASGIVSQSITVTDNTPPTISCPSAIVLGCNAVIPTPNTSAVIASDNCSGAVTVTFVNDGTPTSNSACIETRIRTYKATDACGNTATCTQSISRTVDTIPPVINCPNDIEVECNAPVDPTKTGTPTASDNCSVQLTFHDVSVSQNCFTYITRTWTATDLCGNTSTCTQQIFVTDRTAPVFNCQPTLQLTCGTAIPTPGVTDNCTPSQQITLLFDDSLATGGCQNSRNRKRTWTAIDATGNRSMCVQQISFTVLRLSNPSLPVDDAHLNSTADVQVTAYPNPFENKVTIEFMSVISSHISLQVFDANNSRVAELFSGYAEAGKIYKAYFSGERFAQGVYFYKIISDTKSYTNKLILIK